MQRLIFAGKAAWHYILLNGGGDQSSASCRTVFDKVFPAPPHVSVLDALAYENIRATPQQSISTTTNVDDIETHIQTVEALRATKYLEAIDLRATDQQEVMRELALMGVTAGSLFPGLDGTCESLRERNF